MSRHFLRYLTALLLPLTIAGGRTPAAAAAGAIWISAAELAQRPMAGPAWTQLQTQADQPAGTPNLRNQDQMNNVYVLAKALVFARTGKAKYRTEVRQQLKLAIDTELGGRTLALGRELAAYVIAADLIRLPVYDPAFDTHEFRPWLQRTLTESLAGQNVAVHARRPAQQLGHACRSKPGRGSHVSGRWCRAAAHGAGVQRFSG